LEPASSTVAVEDATTVLLRKAQQGDQAAANKFLAMIRDKHMASRTRMYKNRNVLVDQAEIESEFLLGCFEAMRSAKLDVGNPLMFILWKGGLAVAHLFRKKIREGINVHCRTCGETSMGYTKRRIVCGLCGSDDVRTEMVMIGEAQLTDAEIEAEHTPYDRATTDTFGELDAVFQLSTEGIMIEEIQARLNGRVLELFNIIAVEQINRSTSDNYLQEIATRWGVSTACVSVYLRKLRIAILKYLADDNGDSIGL
jgi:hypothetical protein